MCKRGNASCPARIGSLPETNQRNLKHRNSRGVIGQFHGDRYVTARVTPGKSGGGILEYPACTTLHADNVRVYIVSDDDKPQFEQSRATLALSSETTVPPDQMEAQQARMRRALGLNGESARMRAPQERGDSSPSRQMERFTPGINKRRFVQDGEVPVTLVNGLTPGP